jgi:putative resolvase
VVEHTDRASRFGIASIHTLLAVQGRELVVGNTAQTAEEDLVSMIPSFVARLYGRRRAKRKTEQVLAVLAVEWIREL